MKTTSEPTILYINDTIIIPLSEKCQIIYNKAKEVVVFIMSVTTHKLDDIEDYIKTHYHNFKLVVNEQWIKLDIDEDGVVSINDMVESLKNLFDFIVNYEYQSQFNKVQSELYQKALSVVKKQDVQ
jgi:hypothetical protein